MRKLWHDEAWEEYLYWQSQDKKTLKHNYVNLFSYFFYFFFKFANVKSVMLPRTFSRTGRAS